jgi:hypothetical protein
MSDEQPTWEQIIDDPVGWGYSQEDADRLRGEITLGQTAQLLHKREQDHSAALLLDVQGLSVETYYADGFAGWGSEDRGTLEAILDVETYLVSRFTDERKAEILAALNTVLERDRQFIDVVRVREVLPVVGEGWRDALSRDLAAERPNNQARTVRLEPHRRSQDGLFLTNVEEEKVYAVLRDIQQDLPEGDTILIAPLPGARVRAHTFTPDFLITYRGRAGVIEVDGPHHHGRRGADATRERLLLAAGVRHVGRILVEDLRARAEVEKWCRDFLRRLIAP